MNEREREQERERERRERTCKSKIITLSPSSSPSPRGDPPTARLFVFFFSRGRRKRFYAPGEKFENFSHIRVCAFAGLRAHTYTYIYTHAGETKREKEREREYERESERLLQREKRFLLHAIYYYYSLYTTLLARDKTLNIQCPIFSFFLSSLETLEGARRTRSLSGYLRIKAPSLSFSLSRCDREKRYSHEGAVLSIGGG